MAALLFPLLLFGVLWYFMIRPQRQRMRERELMVARMGVGDRVVTVGGIHGTVVAIDDQTAELEIAAGVVITVARRAIDQILTEPGDDEDDEDWVDGDEDDEDWVDEGDEDWVDGDEGDEDWVDGDEGDEDWVEEVEGDETGDPRRTEGE